MKVHDVVAKTLRDAGVDVVFGLVGDANLYMMESFRLRGGRFVPVANEAAAMLCAAGYAAIGDRLGVGSVTHGPGLANTAHSLYELVKRRSPSVLIAGDTARADRDNFQDIDQRALVVATGARFVEARAVETVAADLVEAMRIAVRDRMPVVFNIPVDFQWADAEPLSVIPRIEEPQRVAPDSDRIEQAVGVIASARRPLILAGRGALAAKEELLALAEATGAPVATTVQARQLFQGVPTDVGIFGGLATDTTTEVNLESDCIVAFGASLNRWTTADGSLLQGRSLVQIDLDPAVPGMRAPATVSIVSDSAAAADAMRAAWRDAELPPSSFADETMISRLEAGRERRSAAATTRRHRELEREQTGQRPVDSVDLEVAMRLLDDLFPSPRTLVIDAGRQCVTALGMLRVEHPAHYVHTIHFGSIGVGVPYAIGAALAEPSRPTLLVCGDGGFMLGGIGEFSTAVRLGLDLTVVVFNDSSFGAEHVQLVRKGFDPALSLFEWPDLADVAFSLGGIGETVTSIESLERALAANAERRGVRLLNVLLDADELSADPARNV